MYVLHVICPSRPPTPVQLQISAPALLPCPAPASALRLPPQCASPGLLTLPSPRTGAHNPPGTSEPRFPPTTPSASNTLEGPNPTQLLRPQSFSGPCRLLRPRHTSMSKSKPNPPSLGRFPPPAVFRSGPVPRISLSSCPSVHLASRPSARPPRHTSPASSQRAHDGIPAADQRRRLVAACFQRTRTPNAVGYTEAPPRLLHFAPGRATAKASIPPQAPSTLASPFCEV
ncbi:hypothetical protein C8Q78DRAFT_317282 [Trametes maxima]|nr:hypothetical protein C8Q78DRAFT_317282 [Trametes maxima]